MMELRYVLACQVCHPLFAQRREDDVLKLPAIFLSRPGLALGIDVLGEELRGQFPHRRRGLPGCSLGGWIGTGGDHAQHTLCFGACHLWRPRRAVTADRMPSLAALIVTVLE